MYDEYDNDNNDNGDDDGMLLNMIWFKIKFLLLFWNCSSVHNLNTINLSL